MTEERIKELEADLAYAKEVRTDLLQKLEQERLKVRMRDAEIRNFKREQRPAAKRRRFSWIRKGE